MNWFRRFMYGRYGNDTLSTFLFVLYLVFVAIQFVLRGTRLGHVLMAASYVIVFLYFFRFLSRDIYRRQRENQRFLRVWNQVRNYFRFLQMCIRERRGTKKLFRCSKCHQIIRVPKGKGKIAITCPKCRFEFVRKT